MGGLTAGRGSDMTSLHTFLHTPYVLGAPGLCVSAHQYGFLLNHKVLCGCVMLRVHYLTIIRSS